MSDLRPPLSKRMRALADSGHPRAAELREAADRLDRIASGNHGRRALLGAWARARRLYCECSGEAL